jgi:hypothetical protein
VRHRAARRHCALKEDRHLREFMNCATGAESTIWLRQSKYGYLWITLAFFLFSFAGHWLLGWFAYVNEQQTACGRQVETLC